MRGSDETSGSLFSYVDLDEAGDAACRPEGAAFGDRRPHGAPPRLCRLADLPQEDRGTVRLDQDRRRHGANHVSRRGACPCPLHPGHGSLQPRPDAPTARRMTKRPAQETVPAGPADTPAARHAREDGKPFQPRRLLQQPVKAGPPHSLRRQVNLKGRTSSSVSVSDARPKNRLNFERHEGRIAGSPARGCGPSCLRSCGGAAV
jgi:hypothetical protein